jgi:hypothetical protein
VIRAATARHLALGMTQVRRVQLEAAWMEANRRAGLIETSPRTGCRRGANELDRPVRSKLMLSGRAHPSHDKPI